MSKEWDDSVRAAEYMNDWTSRECDAQYFLGSV